LVEDTEEEYPAEQILSEDPIEVSVYDEDEDEEEYVPGSVTEAIMAPMFADTDQLQELIINDGKIVAKEAAEEPSVEVAEEESNITVEESEVQPQANTSEPIRSKDLSDTGVIRIVEAAKEPFSNMIREQVAEAVETAIREERPSIREVMQGKSAGADLSQVNPPERMGRLLSQEYDGQISLVMPEEETIEKQITGQLNLEDILAEWENTKKEIEEKRKKQVQQRVLDQTGTMFTEFEAKVRDGILEKLEKDEAVDIPAVVVSEEVLLEETSEELPAVEEPEEIVAEPEVQEELAEAVAEPEEDITEELEEIEEVIEEAEELQEEEVPAEEEEPATEEMTFEEEQEEASEEEVAPVEDAGQEPEGEPSRSMSEEEVALFAPFVQTKGARIRLMQSLDQISLAAYTGNVFVTGETADEAVELAKSVVKEVQMTDRNFSGKVAKVTGFSLNNRDIASMVTKLSNGALIVEMASGMDAQTTKDLLRALNQEQTGIVVVLQDTRKAMHKMMEHFGGMKDIFNVHIEVEELGDDALVAYGKKYARYLEYTIDEMGVLALHTRIEEMQTSDHIVTVADVREIVDEAIDHANRKNLKHFADLLLAKRYDDDDMIILREKDFLY